MYIVEIIKHSYSIKNQCGTVWLYDYCIDSDIHRTSLSAHLLHALLLLFFHSNHFKYKFSLSKT